MNADAWMVKELQVATGGLYCGMTKSTMRTMFQVTLGTMLATVVGLLTMLSVGLLSWPLARGLSGIAIGLIASTVFALLLRKKLVQPISIAASGIGALVACFSAIATAEILPPGSLQWMFQGGLYGAAFGVPVAAILSPLAFIRSRDIKTDSVRE
ncbi:hypothetical protein [Rhodopirellula europaea]|uniref:Putative membrane protein n=1 Tax=Rhodopirellula europaea 6C TaxID=1263867 RepID=M2B457_9BACT|nr:hypothetical protein [Rhodopirellula europaea]EMB16518.1 putative membrane protein [Rhodopirellula europaea 6C]